ncbi:60S ribosomal protein L22 [Anaeramoeba flamelloides]|uniref:Large ribosomal subunit protein eL22 n=1 Tax=Anaeramoeba flamelloides TaxID=1746091 RepID=A0AAV7YQ42_9EUKA|nr:60S ribosomal protein L22 [Anaeramoeba flamelloides]
MALVKETKSLLNDKTKVRGRAGMLGDKFTINLKKCQDPYHLCSTIFQNIFKNITKIYFKVNQTRDYLTPISSTKESYELRYLNIHDDEDIKESRSESDVNESDESDEDEEN